MATTLPGLKGFLMAGQWVQPGGGVATCALSGRQAIEMLCAEDGRRFEVPEAEVPAAPLRQAPVH